MWQKIKYHPFFIRLLSWEYWPIYISNIPVFFFWMIQAIRARDLFFFSTVNPSIATGGFFGEEKHKIYALIPDAYLPRTVYIPDHKRQNATEITAQSGFSYPMVCKPDVGERGMQVKVVSTDTELREHIERMSGGVIVQEYISYPLELSVMCHRFPQIGTGHVTSICRKVFLSVTGNGKSTISELIDQNPRAILQKETLSERMDLTCVPDAAEVVLLEPIGNHCRGTQFLNANGWITPELEATILGLLEQMDGVCYGRFDLRTADIESLRQGKDFQIMEFNGVGSEPAHIYDPSYSVFAAYRDIWNHWQIMYRIAKAQKASGVKPLPWRAGFETLRQYFRYKKKASLTYGLQV